MLLWWHNVGIFSKSDNNIRFKNEAPLPWPEHWCAGWKKVDKWGAKKLTSYLLCAFLWHKNYHCRHKGQGYDRCLRGP